MTASRTLTHIDWTLQNEVRPQGSGWGCAGMPWSVAQTMGEMGPSSASMTWLMRMSRASRASS